MIRALLVDDHQIVRSGVRRVLEATGRFDIVGEAGGVSEALERARLLRPDVVVLDLTLRDGSGLDAIAELREGGARVVILSMQDEPAYARKAFELGAQGYVVKDAADEELADAIDAVLADRIYVHPTLAARLVMREPEDDLTDARAPDPAPDRARIHEPGDRRTAVPERPHDRGAPPAHPRQAAALDAGRARALRARAPHRRGRPSLTEGAAGPRLRPSGAPGGCDARAGGRSDRPRARDPAPRAGRPTGGGGGACPRAPHRRGRSGLREAPARAARRLPRSEPPRR